MIGKLIEKYRNFPISVKASMWFLICGFLQRGISFITTPIFTRILSTAEYGEYSVFNSWLSIITVFVTLNLSSGVYAQGLVKYEHNKNVFSSSLQGLTTCLIAIWTVIYLLFNEFWNGLFGLSTIQMLLMLILIWTTSAYNFWSMEQRTEQKYKGLVAITIFVTLAKPILGIIFVINSDDKVTARILGLVLVELVAYTGLHFAQMLRGKKFYDGTFWKYALQFNIPLIPHYLSMSILNSSDRIMIEALVGKSQAGIYNLAYSISIIMTVFNNALLQTIEPWIYKRIKLKETKEIGRVAYPTFILIAVVNVVLIAFAPEIINIFAPIEYYDAIWVMPPIVMSVFFMFMYSFFASFEFYYEKTNYITMATMIGAVLNIILNYICIEIWGYYAAGYTTLLCYVLFAVCHYCFMTKICKQYADNVRVYELKVVVAISLIFIIVGFAFLLTYSNNVYRYMLIIVGLVALLIKHKQIINFVKSLLEIKKI